MARTYWWMNPSTAEDNQGECDDPDCACHDDDLGEVPGDGAATVTMTEVYEDGI